MKYADGQKINVGDKVQDGTSREPGEVISIEEAMIWVRWFTPFSSVSDYPNRPYRTCYEHHEIKKHGIRKVEKQ